MKLNKDKPYAEIHGQIDEHPGAAYLQDGVYFNGAGDPCEGFGEPDGGVTDPAPKPKAPRKPKAPVEPLKAEGVTE